MGLEDFVPSESGNNGTSGAEISEKFKEEVKRASAGVKRVQKDEKKAIKYDLMLADFLIQIIKVKKYDFLLNDLFFLLDEGYSSHFLLGLISLIYLPISDKIRELTKKNLIDFVYNPTPKTIYFNDNTLDKNIKIRINAWVEDCIDIMEIDYSNLQIEKLRELLSNKESKHTLILFTSKIFQFFFIELNIVISSETSISYVEFILEQITKNIYHLSVESFNTKRSHRFNKAT